MKYRRFKILPGVSISAPNPYVLGKNDTIVTKMNKRILNEIGNLMRSKEILDLWANHK